MSRGFSFFPAYKAEDGKFKPLTMGPDGKPCSVVSRSSGFLDMDFFLQQPMVGTADIDEAFDVRESEDGLSDYYILPLELLSREGESFGMVSGYMPTEEAVSYYASESPQEYLKWMMPSPVPTEVYAEMPEAERNKYVKFSAIDQYSKGYICAVLQEVLDGLFPLADGEEPVVLALHWY